MCRGRWEKPPSDGGPAPLKLTVHRGSLLQDGWLALRNAGMIKGWPMHLHALLWICDFLSCLYCFHMAPQTRTSPCRGRFAIWLLLVAGAAAKGRLVVSFVNEQRMLEAGLDYGGLVKEFLEQVNQTLLIFQKLSIDSAVPLQTSSSFVC